MFLAFTSVGIAQTVQFRASRVRVTVPVGSTETHVITNLVIVTNVTSPVYFEVTGLPPGASCALRDPAGNPLTSTTQTTNLWLWLYLTNIPKGTHTISLNATGGATNNILFVLQSGHVWNGAPGQTRYWSDPASWLGGSIPGPEDEVLFTDLGGQTNLITNCVVDVDATISSLRFLQTNVTRFHTLHINPGKTLAITGANGFSLMRDYISEFVGLGNPPTVTVTGEGGTLIVSNRDATVAVLIDGLVYPTNNFSGLGTFLADVNRVSFGDYSAYPNFWNLDANGYNGYPRRFVQATFLARTNIIRARYADPNNYTNADDRLYSVCFMSSAYSGSTTPYPYLYLGVSNVFYADSVCFVGANQQGYVLFNPAFATNNPIAIFRGLNGGRMSAFAIADQAGTNAGNANIKAWVDFASYNGTVDILADRLYIARDRKLIASDPNFQGDLYISKGIIDVNVAYIGCQDSGGHTNLYDFRGYCRGVLVVSNTAVFKVNDTLHLGYTTETNTLYLLQRDRNQGRVYVGPGGTVMVNTVKVGGVTKWGGGHEVGNCFILSSGAHLIVTNTIAAPDEYGHKKLTTFDLRGATLTLHIKGTQPIIYTTNLNAGTPASTINIAS
ncbi:MAG: hypothetical protein NZ739_03715, partial [Verrucomicrobiae bacterium]|nr:hypothetical protein [Verrucomicrobiae bacterium]